MKSKIEMLINDLMDYNLIGFDLIIDDNQDGFKAKEHEWKISDEDIVQCIENGEIDANFLNDLFSDYLDNMNNAVKLVRIYSVLAKHAYLCGNTNEALFFMSQAIRFSTETDLQGNSAIGLSVDKQRRRAAIAKNDKYYKSLRIKFIELIIEKKETLQCHRSWEIVSLLERDLNDYNKLFGGIVRESRMAKNISNWLKNNEDEFRHQFEVASGIKWEKPPRKKRSS